MKDLFKLKRNEGQNKVLPLDVAIRQIIKPGMKLHINLGNDPNSALREIIRQFQDKNPAFTLITSGVTTVYIMCLIQAEMVKKIITTNCSYLYPTPRPIPFLQEAIKKGSIDIENWSLYSLEQRLMAAAMGIDFMPTKSIIDTSLATDNKGSFTMIKDPFGGKKKTGVISALQPDISLVHGYASDTSGNTILLPPYFSSIWGPRASKNGIVVTVEKLVSTEFIRKHNYLVKIPGYLVKSVSITPFGTHPQGYPSETIGMKGGYGEDYDFTLNYQKISRESHKFNMWIKEWIVECNNEDKYLQKLGSEKVSSLKNKPHQNTWEKSLSLSHTSTLESRQITDTESMVVAAAKEIKKEVIKGRYQTILAGIGVPGLAAWLSYYLLRADGQDITLFTGTGMVGYSPRPGDPFLMSPSNIMTCKMLTDTVEMYGTFVGGSQNKCLSVLGAAQIDKYGNINTLRINDTFFIGPGGAGDAINATKSIVITKQSRDRLLNRLSVNSCPGMNIKKLITNMAVFEKLHRENIFTLTKYFSAPVPMSKDEIIRNIRKECSWEIKVAKSPKIIESPTFRELKILRMLAPQGFFIGK